jgi:hypothetical protein
MFTDHRYRIYGVVAYGIVMALLNIGPALGWFAVEQAESIEKAATAFAIALGIIDASLVEKRRKDGSISALPDDIVEESSDEERTE